VDETSGHSYYTHKATKRATWTAPPEQAPAQEQAPAREQAPSDWDEGVDETSGHSYYTHKATKRATWTAPPEQSPAREQATSDWDEGVDEASGHSYYTHKATKRSTWTEHPAAPLSAAYAAAAAAAEAKVAIAAAQEAAKMAVATSRRASLSDVWTKHEDFMTDLEYKQNGHGDIVWNDDESSPPSPPSPPSPSPPSPAAPAAKEPVDLPVGRPRAKSETTSTCTDQPDHDRIAAILASQQKMKELVKSRRGLSRGTVRVERSGAALIDRYASALEVLQRQHGSLLKLERQTGGHALQLAAMEKQICDEMGAKERNIGNIDENVNRSVSVSVSVSSRKKSILKGKGGRENLGHVASKREPFMKHHKRDEVKDLKDSRRLSMYELTCSSASVSRPDRVEKKPEEVKRLGRSHSIHKGEIRKVRTVSFSAGLKT